GAGFDHGIAARRTLDDAAVDLDLVGLKDHAGARAGAAVESRLGDAHGHAFGLGGPAKERQLRPRPVGGKSRRLARIGQRDRSGDFAVEQRRTKYLRRKDDVLGTDIERRTIAVEGGRRLVATDK